MELTKVFYHKRRIDMTESIILSQNSQTVAKLSHPVRDRPTRQSMTSGDHHPASRIEFSSVLSSGLTHQRQLTARLRTASLYPRFISLRTKADVTRQKEVIWLPVHRLLLCDEARSHSIVAVCLSFCL